MTRNLNQKNHSEAICQVGQSWLVFLFGPKIIEVNLQRGKLRRYVSRLLVSMLYLLAGTQLVACRARAVGTTQQHTLAVEYR